MQIRLGFPIGVAALVWGLTAASSQAQDAGNWSGPYVGGFGQYSTGSSNQQDNGFVYTPPRRRTPTQTGGATPVCPPGSTPITGEGGGTICVPDGDGGVGETLGKSNGDGNYRVSGGFGGGIIGYNYQFARAVIGLEGAIGAGRASGFSPVCGTPAHGCGTIVDAVADVRGRIGYSFGRFLPYIAGGLAVDHTRAYDLLFGYRGGSGWLPGWTVGAGLEYKLTPRISVRAEYLHTEISPKYLYDITTNVPERVGVRMDSVRVGLSYFFTPDAPVVVAKY